MYKNLELKKNQLNGLNDVVLQCWLEFHLTLDYNKFVPLNLNFDIFVYSCYVLSFWLFTSTYVPPSRWGF